MYSLWKRLREQCHSVTGGGPRPAAPAPTGPAVGAPSLTWVKPQNQQTEDQGGQEALFEGLREEVALHRAPKLAKQPQQ